MFDLFGTLLAGRARILVEAYDKHWVICVDLGEVKEGSGERFALAVPAEPPNGTVKLPSPPAQIIEYTPVEVREKREREAACQNKNHALGEWVNGLAVFDMVRRCECRKVREERKATPEEEAVNRDRFRVSQEKLKEKLRNQ